MLIESVRGDRVDVVGIDNDRAVQLRRRSGKLTQHQYAIPVDPRRHELLGDEGHAIAEWRHQHHVGCQE
jgi:hypothetical protein